MPTSQVYYYAIYCNLSLPTICYKVPKLRLKCVKPYSQVAQSRLAWDGNYVAVWDYLAWFPAGGGGKALPRWTIVLGNPFSTRAKEVNKSC